MDTISTAPRTMCFNDACDSTALLDLGAPSPVGWLDLQVWQGEHSQGIGYYCSVDCLSRVIEARLAAYCSVEGLSDAAASGVLYGVEILPDE